MKSVAFDRKLLRAQIVAFIGLAISIVTMAFPNVFYQSDILVLKYYSGTLFWTFLSAAMLLQLLLTIRRRRRLRYKNTSAFCAKNRVGLISLPRTIQGMIASTVFLFSAAVLILLMLCHVLYVIQLIDIAVMILALCLHSVFDGKIWNELCVKHARHTTQDRERLEHRSAMEGKKQ